MPLSPKHETLLLGTRPDEHLAGYLVQGLRTAGRLRPRQERLAPKGVSDGVGV